jgi:aminopeptidase N
MIDANSAAQTPSTNKTIFLKDYAAPDFKFESVDLQFELVPNRTIVSSTLHIKKINEVADIVLNGEELELLSIQIDGQDLAGDQYSYSDNLLTIKNVPNEFSLSTKVAVQPEKNTQLSGLYQSSGNYCTQCEAEGFRRITFFLDRPDVLSIFTVKLIADKANFPVLLSNGNPQESGDLPGDKHFAVWHDPHPKPSYLFAVVAGKLEKVSEQFTTMSGQSVELNVFAEPHNIDKCDYALGALARSMEWDEQVYGREYDLSVYNVVAVDDFNMGAMENKGLNVFNSKYVLALQETATDTDFEGIETVIGHEYFHNWSGNRVTCRDWFQLSLKEGFTVFRDQEFSGDMGSRGVKRISDVNILRVHQFKEDAGPMAHPVRPTSYEEINNFYTVTVYNKGAEVVRMLHTLLGKEQFRKGTDLYFARHDGEAVTTDDFVKSLEDASGRDLSQFKRWYSQAGTPKLTLSAEINGDDYSLTIKQSAPATADMAQKQPFHMPLAIRLLDTAGKELLGETVIELTEQEQTFSFSGVCKNGSTPVLSFLRGYTAPVKVERDIDPAQLECLVQYDNDPFVRWESMQQRVLPELLAQYKKGTSFTALPDSLSAIFANLLSADSEPAMLAKLLSLPNESYFADFCHPVQPRLVREVRESLANLLAEQFEQQWLGLYEQHHTDQFNLDGKAAAARSLKNLALNYLLRTNKSEYIALAKLQYDEANNMTDAIAAVAGLSNVETSEREVVLEAFYQQWQDNALVMDKWLSVQAGSKRVDTFEQVQALTGHPAFSMQNPNKVRALIGAFTHNLSAFHQDDGSAYAFYADKVIELNAINPQVAARMVSAFNQWKTFAEPYKAQMQTQLERINAQKDLSKDVREIVSKALA